MSEVLKKDEEKDIVAVPDCPKPAKQRKRVSKGKNKVKDDEIEESKTEKSEEATVPQIENNIEEIEQQLRVYMDISHSLNDDSTLFEIDDFDFNHMISNCRPLVLSTTEQLSDKINKEVENLPKSKAKKIKKTKTDNSFSHFDNVKDKKSADNIGSLLNKTLSIESILEASWKRSIMEFITPSSGAKNKRKKIGSRRSNRVNNEIQASQDMVDNIYFDPIMSLYFYFRQNMMHEIWSVRQYSCANLEWLINIINISDYLKLVPDIDDVDTLKEALVLDMATRGIILTLMDHFGDYQENRVLTPVRELSVKLIIPRLSIIPLKAICGTILSSKKLYWMYKYNVLLLLKTILVEGKANLEKRKDDPKFLEITDTLEELRSNKKIFDNVCKWLDSEDELKILGWECVEQLLKNFFSELDEPQEGEDDWEGVLKQWTDNTTTYNDLIEEMLKSSDDIECTAISVFNLLYTILKYHKYNHKGFIDFDWTLPFNFHRVSQVRLAFTLLMNRVTKMESDEYEATQTLKFTTSVVLQKLFILGMQSWLIEQGTIVKNWFKILQNMISIASKSEETLKILTFTIQDKFTIWMNRRVFDSFEDFMILNTESFDKISSYYELKTKPVTVNEIEKDYAIREWNSSKAWAIIMAYCQNKELRNLVSQNLNEKGSLMSEPYYGLQIHHLLVYYHLSVLKNKDSKIDIESSMPHQILEELLKVLENITIETYPMLENSNFEGMITSIQYFSKIIGEKTEVEAVVSTFNQCVQLLNGIMQK